MFRGGAESATEIKKSSPPPAKKDSSKISPTVNTKEKRFP
jgi:hypothetical protein